MDDQNSGHGGTPAQVQGCIPIHQIRGQSLVVDGPISGLDEVGADLRDGIEGHHDVQGVARRGHSAQFEDHD